jgi:hypothetical protein
MFFVFYAAIARLGAEIDDSRQGVRQIS